MEGVYLTHTRECVNAKLLIFNLVLVKFFLKT